MPLAVKQGLRFNGLTDYVRVPSKPSFDGWSQIIVEATLKMDIPIIAPNTKIVSRRKDSYFWFIGVNGTGYYGGVGNGAGTVLTVATTTTPSGNVETLKMTFDNTTRLLSLYINNVLAVSGIVDGQLPLFEPLGGRDILIGASTDGADTIGQYFKGNIYAVKVSNQNGVVAQYSATEGTGTTTADTSGNGNNGTITGATWLIRTMPKRFNLLGTDGGFETEFTGLGIGWTQNSAIPSLSTTKFLYGSKSQKLSPASSWNIQHPNIATKLGGYYIAVGSMYVESTNETATVTNRINSTFFSFDATKIGQWQTKYLKFVGTGNENWIVQNALIVGGVYYIDGFRIYEIDKATYDLIDVDLTYTGGDNVSAKFPYTEPPYNLPALIRQAPQKPKKNMLPSFKSGQWTIHANAVVNSDYSLTLNATAASQRSGVAVNVIPNAQYTISSAVGSSTFYFNIRDTNNVGTLIATTGVSGTTFTAPASGIVYIETTNTATSGTFTFTNPQLEQGSTATAFEAYQLINDIKVSKRVLAAAR